ncbi:MAG: hypothetical protein RL417_1597 [Pseudomonadota bacterium]|jgi:heat shock protein HtpX
MNQQIKTLLLLGVLSSFLIAFGGMMGPGYLWAFTIFALVMNVGAYFFSHKIVLAMHHARELSPQEAPQIFSMTRELAQAAEIPMPKLYLIESPEANAFATGRNPQNGVVAITSGIARILSPAELRGVIAHEIAHIKNRDILITTIASIIGAAITNIANVLQFSAIFGGRSDEDGTSPLSGLAMAILAPIAAMIIQMSISRTREYLADEVGARIAGDPLALANALRKLSRGYEHAHATALQPATSSMYIVTPFHGGLMNLLSTHPPMEKRITLLEGMVLSGRRAFA